jgi:Acetyltransferase (GNAT) domain
MTRIIRTLTLDEIGVLLDWAAAEGWNPGLGDALTFHAIDPAGFIGAFVDEVMVAGIAAVAYDRQFGFIGLYICHPRRRGQGHGRAVWDAGMAHLAERTVGLDGVPEQQANYRSMGFREAYQTVRMSGVLPPAKLKRTAEFREIANYDRNCFPAERSDFLKGWTRLPNLCAGAWRDEVLRGYAVLRPCREGHKLGPLFADETAVALELVAGMEGVVQLDVPDYQASFIRALEEQGFVPGFTTTRMYRGPAPEVERNKVFGITSLELG